MTPTALLIPGNMCDARLWSGGGGVVPAALQSLGIRVELPELVPAPSIAAMADALLARFPGPLVPLGFSMGGIVALAMAARAPHRIARMALLDTNAAADLPARAAQRPRQQAEARAGRLAELVTEEMKPNYLAEANAQDRALLTLLRDMALDLGPEIFVAQSEALRTRPDQRHVLPALDAPVLLACGAEDTLCPPAWHHAMAAAARRPTLHIVPHAGHMLPLEQPFALAELLARWLAR